MRSLSEIIEAAKTNQEASIEELKCSLLALESLWMFDHHDLRHLAFEGDKILLRKFYGDESFRRAKLALAQDPQKWLGPNYDPRNPGNIQRHLAANKLAEALFKSDEDSNIK